jgi:hypothetical protein
MAKFVKFLLDRNYIKRGDETQVFTPHPHKDTPWWICLWILDTRVLPHRPCRLSCLSISCDVIDADGNPISKDKEVPTYAHAQKMRAAMSYAFGRLHRLGNIPWQEVESGRPTGNPSVSELVSSYMVSLRRRKVCFLVSLPE